MLYEKTPLIAGTNLKTIKLLHNRKVSVNAAWTIKIDCIGKPVLIDPSAAKLLSIINYIWRAFRDYRKL